MKPLIAIRNGRVMTPKGITDDGVVLIEGSKIKFAGRAADVQPFEADEIVDAGGRWVLPGFIDLHCHGGKGSDVMDGTLSDIETIARYHAGGGTTAFLPTTASSSLDNILRALKTIHKARQEGTGGAYIIGAHIEGPFFAYPKRGCHLPTYVRNPRPIEYDRILEYAEDIASMTLAPELDGAEDLIKALVENKIVVSIGHSDATYDQVVRAVKLGASHVTHIFCAMSSIIKDGPKRISGIVEAALLLDELTTEVIADGKHLPPELIRLTIKAKGVDKVCAVTDSIRGAGMPPGVYTFGPKDGQEAIVQDNMAIMPDRTGYAGGVLRMNNLIRTLIGPVGLSLTDAIKMVTIVPARIVGMEDRMGSLEEGKDANIVIADDDMEVYTTIVNGRKVQVVQ